MNEPIVREHSITRRSLLKAAVAGAVTGSLFAPGVAAAAPNSTRPAYDTIVVGAGFAGVTSARALRRMGLKVLVLEARDRIGGRAWTSSFEGEEIELGGTWVDRLQENVWSEIESKRIGFIADPAAENTIFPTESGFAPIAPAESFGRQGELLTRFADQALELFPDAYNPLAASGVLRESDNRSVREHLDSMRLSVLDERWLSGATGGLGGGSNRAAYTQFLHWWALCNYNAEQYYGINTFRPIGGMSRLARTIFEESGAEIRLSSPVKSIVDDGRRVIVRTRGGASHSASSVVLAVPVNNWRHIEFSPGLSPAKRQASLETVGVTPAKKMCLHMSDTIGNTYVHTPEGYPIDTLVPHKRTSRGWLMTAFSSDPRLDVNNAGQIQQALQLVVPNARVFAARGQDWGSDAFSLGGWSFRQPGQLTKLFPEIQQPQGRIFFATSDIASGWSGYVEGAMESGLVASGQVSQLVS